MHTIVAPTNKIGKTVWLDILPIHHSLSMVYGTYSPEPVFNQLQWTYWLDHCSGIHLCSTIYGPNSVKYLCLFIQSCAPQARTNVFSYSQNAKKKLSHFIVYNKGQMFYSMAKNQWGLVAIFSVHSSHLWVNPVRSSHSSQKLHTIRV